MIDETQDIIVVNEPSYVEETTKVELPDPIVTKTEEAFPPLGIPNEQLKHTLLTELEVDDQHPIEAVTGLRTAIDEINSLKSIYSDGTGTADYYEWAGDPRDAVGYFVSLVPHSSMIKICNGKNIFGVTVDRAGFIGHEGFVEVEQRDGVTRKVRVGRDEQYALVATSGFVEVRCEVDVAEGDYVISNEFGKAQKARSEYGYKVIDLETKHDIKYAVIALGVQADITEDIGRDLMDLNERMSDAEKNITSLAAALEDNTDEIDELKEDVSQLQELDTQVKNAALTAAQAKAIAASAVASAETWRNEAVEEANKAFSEAVKVREEFEKETSDMKKGLETASLELQEAKEDLWREQGKMQNSLNDVDDYFRGMRHDLIPLYSWSGEEGESIAGFVSQADADRAVLGGIVEWKNGEGVNSLAGYVAEATGEYATVKELAEYKFKDETGKEYTATAALDAYAKANEAAINAIVGIDGSLAGLTSRVDKNTSSVTTLASHIIGDYVSIGAWDEKKAEVGNIYYGTVDDRIVYYYHNGTEWKSAASIASITSIDKSLVYYVPSNKLYYYYKDGTWQSTEKSYEAGLGGSIAGVQQTADENSAKIEMITSLEGEFGEAIAGLVTVSGEDRAELDALAQYGYIDENGEKHCGAAGIMAEVDKNKAAIEAIAGIDGDIAGFKAQVDKNSSYATMLAERVMGTCVTIPLTNDSLSKDTSTVYYDSSANLYWYYAGGKWNSTSNWGTIASAALSTSEVYYVVGSKLYWYYKDGTWKSNTSAYDAGLSATIGGIQVETDENSAKIDQLTSWQGDTNSSLTLIRQKSDANGASIQLLAANIDKHSVGERSQANGFTLEQAIDILEPGAVYVPTIDHTETYTKSDGSVVTYSFTKGNSYEWVDTGTWNESIGKVIFFATPPAGTAYEFWYKNSASSDGYEGYTLYKPDSSQNWVSVASLKGSASNRAVSQIRQDANSIALEVTNARGSAATLGARLTETEAEVQSVAAWSKDVNGNQYNLATIKQTADSAGASIAQVVTAVGKDGEVNASTIVQAVNEDGSGVFINADHIQFEGFVSFANKSETVFSTQVEYALSSSSSAFVALTEWSTSAPTWRADAYMWQRTVITKGDGSVVTSNPTCIQGAKGEDGTGVSIKGVAYVNGVVGDSMIGGVYAIYKDKNFTSQITGAVDGDSYLIDGYLFVYSGSGDAFVCSGKIQGDQGEPGAAVTAVVNYYMASSRSAGVAAGDGGEIADEQWTTTIQNMTANKPYLWNYEISIYTDTTSQSTNPVIIGRYGSDGRGIAAIQEFYCISASTSCSTPTDATLNAAGSFGGMAIPDMWYTTSPSTTQAYRYLWNCERIIYTDGTSETFPPANIGTHGEQGDAGVPVKEIRKEYYLSTSKTACIGGVWGTEIYNFANAKNKYLWTRDVIVYADNTEEEQTPVYDPTYTSIAQWCIEEGKTLIDGANIATGTIAAAQIAANSITADKLAVGALTADSITVKSSGGNTIFHASTTSREVQAGGFYIDTNSLYSHTTFANSGLILSSTGTNGAFSVNGSTSQSGWKILAGTQGETTKNFGIDSSGYLYASGANVSGTITASEGEIGGFTVGTNSLRTGTRSYFYSAQPDMMPGVYITPDLSKEASSAIFTSANSGGISFGTNNASSGLYSQQCIYAGRHVIRGKIGAAKWAGTTLTSSGLYFLYNTSGDISPIYETNYCIGQIVCNDGKVTLEGSAWYDNSGLAISSARLLKDNIASLDNRHSVFFDNLIPRSFTYKDGTSNRTHYGLVVDELKSAMDAAGITPAECAAYCLTDPENPDGDGGIRYSELIALCIKEIQTLKQKVKELEKENANE